MSLTNQQRERESAMQIDMKKIYNRSRFAIFQISSAISMVKTEYHNHRFYSSFLAIVKHNIWNFEKNFDATVNVT